MRLSEKLPLVEQGKLGEFFQQTWPYWNNVTGRALQKSGRRIYARALLDHDDVRQEVVLAVLEAIDKHDPVRGPLGPFLVFVGMRDGIRRSIRASGWHGSGGTGMFRESPCDDDTELELTEPVFGHSYSSRAVRELLPLAETELERDICELAQRVGVADAAMELLAEPSWYGDLDEDEARRLVRRALRGLVERCKSGKEKAK